MLFHIRHGLTALTLLLAVATPVFGHPHPVCDHDHEHHQDLIQRDTHPHGPAKGVEPITLNEYGVRSRIRDLLESTKDLSSREILKRDFTRGMQRCKRTKDDCVANAQKIRNNRDRAEHVDQCLHDFAQCISDQLVEHSQTMSSAQAKGEVCWICFDSLHGGDRLPVTCTKHGAKCHTKCLKPWFPVGTKCPVCGRDVFEKEKKN